MSTLECEVSAHSLRLDGEGELVFRPCTVTAYSGSFQAATVPLRSGNWRDFHRRLFEADRFLLRRGRLDGTLWLSLQQTPQVRQLPLPSEGTLHVVTQQLLCAELGSRTGSRRLRLVPGSTRKTLTVSEFSGSSAGDAMSPVVATVSGLNQAVLEEGQVLHVNPGALVGWTGCGYPKAFCAKLRFRDLFLPRLPETLTLDFDGPGRVYFQGAPGRTDRKRQAWGMPS